MKNIFISGKIPEDAYYMLLEKHNVIMNRSEKPIPKDQLIQAIKGKDALLCILSDKVDREVIESNPDLKIIANYGAGFDNIDLKAASENNIIVTNTPLVSTVSTAELTFALILGISRRVAEGDRLVRAGSFEGWAPMFHLGTELKGKKLGVVGMGNIGKNVASIGRAFGMEILYHNRSRLSEIEERKHGLEYMSKEELLVNSDIVTLHLSYNKDLKHYVGREELNMMKTTAYLINAARGPLVDEHALLDALWERKIAGAALDVFECEPAITKGLESLDNVLLTPHIGNATIEARTQMAIMAAENILEALDGERPKNFIQWG